MHEFAEKKEKKLQELLRKHPSLKHSSSMSEGPMLVDESKGIEARARQQYEKSVKIELSEIKRLQKLLRKYKRKKGKLIRKSEEKKEKMD